MESDEEDFVFYGTPIEREEELTSRKKKSVAEAAGQLRTLPSWQQEVRDEDGRRRFHGAFTGGFSAGYYNTVGSKEGWTPQTFTSSRKKRAETKEQSILNFLDDDEKAELDGRSLATSALFDTFGFTAAEVARKQAEKEQEKRPSAIPGPVPDEIVLPASNSIGVKLLLKMGWRHGHSIKDSRTTLQHDARREARKAFLALSSDQTKPSPVTQLEPNDVDHEGVSEKSSEDVVSASKSTPVFVLDPKQDMHGLGYDPFKHAPEFRDRKRLRVSGNREHKSRGTFPKKDLFASKSGKAAPGFGIGALEELDAEDDDIYASGYDFEETYVQDVEEPSTVNTDIKLIKSKGEDGVLPGFKVAESSDFQLQRFNPPVIPNDFKPQHKFPAALEIRNKLAGPPPPEVPNPEDKNLKLLIDGFAALVTRCGKLFEDLSREKNKASPLFSFLSGGNGHDYYARRLWEEQQKHNDQTKQNVDTKAVPSVQKMTAESRGRILGEKPLERSYKDPSSSSGSADAIQLQFNLSDTFTKPASLSDTPEVVKPFKADPAKQERFEQFLKEKYHGGLRSTESGGNSKMSESARARERLDFEAAAEVIEKGQNGSLAALDSKQQFTEISVSSNLQFTSGGLEDASISKTEEQMMMKLYPKREEYQWRPAPLVCKRFDITDPYMGKPPPPPRARSRMDSLIFTSDIASATKSEKTMAAIRDSILSQSEAQVIGEEVPNSETEIVRDCENVERPVDLYKAIFSDDSDAEEDDVTINQKQDPERKAEVANSTLNRLIAGDFLESLGKELGLAKYIKYISNIRTIQDYLCNRADKHLVPKINNTNVDRSVAVIHATVFSSLRRREAGEQLYDPITNTVSLIDEEYKKQCAANSMSSKGMFQLIQRQGSSRHLMAFLNNDGVVAKAWPVESDDNQRPFQGLGNEKRVGSPLYGPLQIEKAESINLQFGNFGLSAFPNDTGGTSHASSVDESGADGTESEIRYFSSGCSSPRMCDGHAKELKEELSVSGSDEEADDQVEVDSNDPSDEGDKEMHEELEGSVDEESKSDDEYDDLAMQDGLETG